jgi:hypothetical protein
LFVGLQISLNEQGDFYLFMTCSENGTIFQTAGRLSSRFARPPLPDVRVQKKYKKYKSYDSTRAIMQR